MQYSLFPTQSFETISINLANIQFYEDSVNIIKSSGKIDKIEALEIIWPNGKQEYFSIIDIDTEITIHQGNGQPL